MANKNTCTNPRKLRIGGRFCDLLDKYTSVISFSMDLVGSKQLAMIRKSLRGKAEFLFGKNTMLRKVLRDKIETHEKEEPEKANKLGSLLHLIEGNVGLLFHGLDVKALRDEVESQKLPSAAKVGIMAPCSVSVKAGPTGCDPTQTSFFQMMDIPTKINRGQVEIVSDVVVIKEGEKVGASQAALCAKLNITPFEFGPKAVKVYDNGDVYAATVLDITPDMIETGFKKALRKASALCMAADLPSGFTVPQYIYKAWQEVSKMLLATEQQGTTKLWQEYLDSFGSGGPAVGGGGGGDAGAAAAAPAEESEEEESDADAPAGGGLFGGSGSDSDSSS